MATTYRLSDPLAARGEPSSSPGGGAAYEPIAALDRSTFEEALGSSVSRAQDSGSDRILVLLEIDNFSDLRQAAATEITRQVVAALRLATREVDFPAHLGEGRYGVVLPASSRRESFPAAAHLRGLLSEIRSNAPLTMSAGIASYPANAHTGQGLLRAAEEALQEAKRSGGDRARRSTRGSLYRSNERRKALGKAPVRPLEQRRSVPTREAEAPKVDVPRTTVAEVETLDVEAGPVESKVSEAPPMSVAKRLALLAPLITAKPAPPSTSTGTVAYKIEARLREIAASRLVN